MIGAAVSICVSLFVGLTLVRVLWVPGERSVGGAVLRVGLGLAAGTGLTSIGCFLALAIFPGLTHAWLVADCALVALAILSWIGFRREAPVPSPRVDTSLVAAGGLRVKTLLWILFAACAAASLWSFRATISSNPFGGADARDHWNVRARVMSEGCPAFLAFFDSMRKVPSNQYPPAWNADYPLLLPGSIARAWLYSGSSDRRAPAWVAFGFAVSIVLVVVGGAAALGSSTGAAMAGLFLLGAPFFTLHAASLYADVPLALYTTGALVCMLLASSSHPPEGLLALSGLLAGLGAWTKNEGMLYLLSLAAAFCFVVPSKSTIRIRSLASFFGGAALPLVTLAFFKLRVTGVRNWLGASSSQTKWLRMLSLERWTIVSRKLWSTFARGFGWTPPLVVVAGLVVLWLWFGGRPAGPGHANLGWLFLLISFAGLVTIYVWTPYDLSWQLDVSAERVLLQLWPSFVLLLFGAIRWSAPAEIRRA